MLRFDHHCPYINNCVGARNFRQFALMVGLNLMNINVGSLVIFIGTRSTPRSRHGFAFESLYQPHVVIRMHTR